MKKSLLAIVLLSSLSTVALANQAGDILIRGGVTMVTPDIYEQLFMPQAIKQLI
jgi:outer membrane protein